MRRASGDSGVVVDVARGMGARRGYIRARDGVFNDWWRIGLLTVTFRALAVMLQTPKGSEAAKWETYTSAAGFSVSLPGAPVEQGPKVAGGNITVVAKDGDKVYMVIKVANTPPTTKDKEAQFFKEIRESLDKIAKVSSEKPVKLMESPGREYEYEMVQQGRETIVVRSVYLLTSPEVVYNMQVIRGKTKPAASEREVASFFDSLKLVDLATARKMARTTKLEFKPFAPAGAGFSIIMPGKPDETTQETKTANFKLHAYECGTPAGAYSISVLEYGADVGNSPDAKKTEVLIRLLDAMVAQDKGQDVKQQSTEFQGFPARMIRYVIPVLNSAQMTEIRAVMAGAKVFVVMAKIPVGLADPTDVDKFFESFKLTNAKAPAVAANEAPGAMVKRGRPATAPRIGARAPRPNAGAARVAATPRPPRADRISWKRFNSAVGGFTVDMPGEPAQTHEENGLMGAKGVELVTGEHEESRFIVQYQDLTRTATKKGTSAILKAARSADEKVIAGKVVGEKEATLKGASGGWAYQIESADPDGPVGRVRAYVVGTRLYQVIVVAPKAKFPTDESERFFRSFRLQTRT
jgi:hypothetical protein